MATNDVYSYLKQRAALSGQQPTSNMVDSIVQGELSSAYDTAIAEQAQQQKQYEFNQQIAQQEQARKTATATGIGQTAAQMATMYGMSDSHAIKDAANSVGGAVGGAYAHLMNPGLTSPAYTSSASTGVGSVASSTGLNSVAPTVIPTEASIPTVSGASGFSQIPTDASLGAQAIQQPATGLTLAPSATGGGEVAAPGMIAGAGGSVGGAIGSAVGAVTGSETATATGTALGSAIGSGISSAAPYGLTLPLASGLHKGVDALFNINEDNTGKVIGDVFDPLKGVSDLVGTWICTATAKHSRVKKTEEAVMKKLRIYAKENHPGWWNSYFKNGTHLVGEIAQQETDLPKFYDNIRKILIEPVVKTFDKDPEEAFQIYLFITQTLFKAYMPEFEFKEI